MIVFALAVFALVPNSFTLREPGIAPAPRFAISKAAGLLLPSKVLNLPLRDVAVVLGERGGKHV